MKDITRSCVNISSKGQEKVQGVFTRKLRRTTDMKQADQVHRNMGRRTRLKVQGDEQVGEKSKQLKQIMGGNPGRMLALALSR